MSIDLILKPSCSGCGSTAELYGSTCKHLTLCLTCGKTMAENRAKCYECGAPITRLIREYNVRACSASDKNYFIGRFITGLPNFSKKKSENKWSLQKEGLMGRQVTDTLRVLVSSAWLQFPSSISIFALFTFSDLLMLFHASWVRNVARNLWRF